MKKISIIMFFVIMMSVFLMACGSLETGKANYRLTYKEGKKVSINETEYIGIFFDFTNDSGETVLPCDTINVKAFQNGKELTVVVYSGQTTEGAIQCDTAVQTGTNATVVWTFEAQDNSKVSVECTDGQKIEFEIE